MKANIEVNATDARSGYAFDVVVREGKSETRHRVTLTEEDLRCFGGGKGGPTALVRESFRFLLEREPKESILARFDLPVIARYFPEYPEAIRTRLGSGGVR